MAKIISVLWVSLIYSNTTSLIKQKHSGCAVRMSLCLWGCHHGRRKPGIHQGKAFLAELLKELSLEASQHIASLIKHKVIKKKWFVNWDVDLLICYCYIIWSQNGMMPIVILSLLFLSTKTSLHFPWNKRINLWNIFNSEIKFYQFKVFIHFLAVFWFFNWILGFGFDAFHN